MLAEKTQKLENVAQSLRERTWWAYDSFGVVYGDWRITIDRKPNVYRPFLFSVAGVKKRRTLASPRVTCNRRYCPSVRLSVSWFSADRHSLHNAGHAPDPHCNRRGVPVR